MTPNSVRRRLRSGQSTVGSFLSLGSSTVAELMSHSGFDWLVIDTEHGAIGPVEVQQMLMAVAGSEVVPLVRISAAEPMFIQQALDMGAMGVVVPLIRTSEDARSVVRATRFPPDGSRGFGPVRASRYFTQSREYFREANDNVLVVLLIETQEALANLDDIASIPGVDALYLGTFDLCLAMGLDPLTQPHPEVEAAIEQVLKVGLDRGIAIGRSASTPAEVSDLRLRGYRMIGFGSDFQLIGQAARTGIAAFNQPKQ